MNYKRLDKKILISWRIARLIAIIILGIILTIAMSILSTKSFFKPYLIPAYIIIGMISIYSIITLILYPAIEYKQWGYIITEDRIEIRHGIFFIQNTVIPIVRIQHIAILQGPINRKLGISSVNIHTASGTFEIQGISDEEARLITEGLKSKLYNRLENQNKRIS